MPRIGVDLGVVFTLNNLDFDSFIFIVLAGDRIDIPARNVANLFKQFKFEASFEHFKFLITASCC